MTATTRASARLRASPVVVRREGLVDYDIAWAEQQRLAAAAGDGSGPDTLLLLQHPTVYTAGRRTLDSERPVDGTPVLDVDRGGKITWHGPGQLVGYPVVRLADPVDVVDWVRRIEEALIGVCTDLGLTVGRVTDRSGVWLAADGLRPQRKIAAIGIRVARGVAMHGFALNCDPDLSAFGAIVPCGIADAGVTSLSAELMRPIGVADVIERTATAVLAAIEGELPVAVHHLPATALTAAPGRPPHA